MNNYLRKTGTCKHCQEPIEYAESLIHNAPRWRHSKDQMFSCFAGAPMKDESGYYKRAEPEEPE